MGPSANLNSPWVIVSGVNRSRSRKAEKPDQLLWFCSSGFWTVLWSWGKRRIRFTP
jgi:hypothetical protein